jgi:GAF domain-containing protein
MILFLGKSKSTYDEVRALNVFPEPIIHHRSIKGVRRKIGTPITEVSDPPIVIVDATDLKYAISTCRDLREDAVLNRCTIIALISELEARGEIMNAGADDYLVLPLIPAEIQGWLSAHQHVELRCLELISEISHQVIAGKKSGENVIKVVLQELVDIFSASGAWLYLYNQGTDELQLIGCFPPLPHMDNDIVPINMDGELVDFAGGDVTGPKIIHLPVEDIESDVPEPQTRCLISIPLCKECETIGLLNLGYPESRQLSWVQERMFSIVGKSLLNLMDLEYLRGQGETFAMRTGLFGLIGKIISQETDQRSLLSLTLEHTVPLLNASMGSIWMLTEDGEGLEMVSYLSPFPIQHKPRPIKKEQGLIGWVASSGKTLYADDPTQNRKFDPKVDQWLEYTGYSLLAVPIRNHDETLGVLALYNTQKVIYEDQDLVTVESIASLSASCIATACMIQELREYSKQLRALYEMSQQIAQGLDLHTTLNRALQWANRLIESEIGLLWLIEEQEAGLKLVATLGMEIEDREPTIVPLKGNIFGWVADHNQAALVNSPASDSRTDTTIHDMLGMAPRNLISLPMIYRGDTIGVLGLINKVGGVFQETDLALASTAADMIAIAVGNARLHAQTLDLMEQRERTHALAVQTARLATMGRLTASMSHEINNPMQAIRGALALAMEDPYDEDALIECLSMCMQESDRVVHLIDRMRHIYRPSGEGSKPVHINDTIQEIVATAQKVSRRQGIALRTDLDPNVAEYSTFVDQLHIIFLNLVLSLSDAISEAGGGDITIRSSPLPSGFRVEFETNRPVPDWAEGFTQGSFHGPTESGVCMTFCQEILHSLGGTIQYVQKEHEATLAIELPLSESAR